MERKEKNTEKTGNATRMETKKWEAWTTGRKKLLECWDVTRETTRDARKRHDRRRKIGALHHFSASAVAREGPCEGARGCLLMAARGVAVENRIARSKST